MANPYLTYFRLLPPSCRRDASLPIVAHGELMSPGWLSFKNAVAGFYSWAVPTQSAIDVIAETTARVVEIRAGSGYY